jgi:CHAD domain-containing protein
MLAQVERPAGPLTEDVLHRYRTVVKRARYVAEFASKSAESLQFTAELKRLQDAIGNWHDWLTLTETATRRLGGVNESSLVAALHNVTGAKFRNAAVALAASTAIEKAAKPAILSTDRRKLTAAFPTSRTTTESAA